MPSKNQRVNLTLNDEVYEQLQNYKKKYGIPNDATACRQLVVQQLKSLETTEEMTRIMKEMTVEQLLAYTNQGMKEMKAELDKT
jgi:hypothetical protein